MTNPSDPTAESLDQSLVHPVPEYQAPVLSTGYRVGRGMAVLSLLVIVLSIVIIVMAGGHETMASAIALCAIILAVMVLFGGIMVAVANKPEAVATERLRKSMSEDEREAWQNHKVARRGWWVTGISLFAVFVTMLTASGERSGEVRIFGGIFAGGGVLVGMIIVLTHSYSARVADTRHEGLAATLRVVGMIAMMLALAASIARLSWPISIIAVSLSAFELWALFWGSRSGALLAVRALGQLGLFATVFYAAASHAS
ncbi:MAG: hypothetical protein QOD64_714, partial [Verrucomicrobiota bacterium]